MLLQDNVIHPMQNNKILHKILVLIAALLASAVLTDLFIRFAVNFPPTSIAQPYHVYPNDSYKNTVAYENIYRPYAKYFTNEKDFRIFQKNNYGLPGLDITEQGKTNIFLIGNSYVESLPTPPHLLASSIFMDLLQGHYGTQYQVVNLGLGGQTPYYGLYRLKFWSQKIKPDYVILVLESFMLKNAEKQPDSMFVDDKKFGLPVTIFENKPIASLCAISSFAHVVNSGIFYANNARKQSLESKKKTSKPTPDSNCVKDDLVYHRLLQTILEYKKMYGDNFLLYSLLDKKWNELLYKDCATYKIKFSSDSKIRKNADYHLGNWGHFNNQGNKALGYELYRLFVKSTPVQ